MKAHSLKRPRPPEMDSSDSAVDTSTLEDLHSHRRRHLPFLVPDHRNHILSRSSHLPRIRAVEALLERGFPYSRKLDAHTACVNALAFSSLDGRFLVSGGDDLDIHFWDLHQEGVTAPSFTFRGPRANIFVLKFSANNRFIFSGGADDIVLKFDSSSAERLPESTYRQHEDSIRGIAPHPVQDEVFITGAEDGRLIRHDSRSPSSARIRAQDTIQLTSEVTGVEFHPVMEHIFATSDQSGQVCLRDTRMAFGPLAQRTQEGIVQIYNTKLSRPAIQHLSNPEVSSLVFNGQGTQLSVAMLNFNPTIYNIHDSDPVAVCSAGSLPDGSPIPPGERTYANACTMKHGGFGGPGLDRDTLYLAGSDDFRAYVWALPPPETLAARRKVLSYAEWRAGEHIGVTAFAEHVNGPRCIPVQLDTPRARLAGHHSIVNSVVVHPQMLLAATSGVESRVMLHGAVDSLCGGMKRTPAKVRGLGEPWEPDLFEEDDGEDEEDEEASVEEFMERALSIRAQRRTIRMFDGCGSFWVYHAARCAHA
ncbi:WD40 repeat-like protein [Favolaschia claudopus]|uniref:WD40 repeat-like protein n=1 Tax=Favolaschia claudopus TaxID=2862362 RepID=A0AAW0B8P2_9AGAR